MPLKSTSGTRNSNTRKVAAFSVKGRQLEAAVHTSLPPLVKGALRAHLVVSLEGGIVWEYNVGPPTPKLCVLLKWWGEKSLGTMFRVPVHVSSVSKSQSGDSTSLAYFPVRSALSQLSAYLKDMGSLTFQVGLGHMTDNSMVIGQAVVSSLKQLTPRTPLKGHFPVINSSGVHLGKLSVHISIKVSAQSREEPAAQRKVTLDVPEFIVGPGPSLDERLTHKKTSNERTGTLVGEQGRVERDRMRYGNVKEIHIPTGSREEGEEEEEGGVRAGERTELGTQQIEVISELIERGQRLRDKMVESIVARGIEDKASFVERRNGSLSSEVQHQMCAGEDADINEIIHDVDIVLSSDEEHILSDVSLDESDYPLHNGALVSALYSLDQPPPATGTTNNHGEPDLTKQGEEIMAKSEESTASERQPSLPTSGECTTKLSSKLSQDKTVASVTCDQPRETGPEDKETSPGSVSSSHAHYQGSKTKTDSLTTLLSHFVKGQSSLEAAILAAIGLDRLTQLGRVGSARITIGDLRLEAWHIRVMLTQHREKTRVGKPVSSIPPPAHSTKSPTYFVEYQFPAVLHQQRGDKPSLKRVPRTHELMRIASKRMKNGVVKFNHHSVFPLKFSSPVIHHWWNSSLIFRVYCRPPTQRMPFLLGKAVLPLKRLLTSKTPSGGRYNLELKTSSLADAVNERDGDDTVVGSVEVLLEFVQSGRDASLRLGGAEDEEEGLPECTDEVLPHPLGGSDVEGRVEREHTSPIHFREKNVSTKDISEKPPALQLLMLIPEAIDVSSSPSPPLSPSLPPADEGDRLSLPNCYLICKLFCTRHHPPTPVQWASHNPQFGFKQLFPLYLTPALLKQVMNNFTVVEVWHRTPGADTDDELVGLVKLSLHQFYLAFSEEESFLLCSQAELPVVAVDSYCPIVNPFSGHLAGHLAVLMALGTPTQISHLQQQYASGHYSLQLPHKAHTRAKKLHLESSSKQNGGVALDFDDFGRAGGPVEHVFELCVEGVREVATFASTVWGEADCFVQYHFPTLNSEDDATAEVEVSLHPYRTGTTLCIPNPSFSHEARHSLSLSSGKPVQQYLMAACGGGVGGGVPFELWKRYYYPNIRDQLVARTILPVAKLCALVTMQGAGGGGTYSVQDFALPLKLTDSNSASDGGVLDVSLRYESIRPSPGKSLENIHHINITVGILRATGLKDAVALVAPDNPVALGLAAEVGVNTYATISLPGLTKEKRTTKTIARSFSPDFSHTFDLALPLTFRPPKSGPPSPSSSSKAVPSSTSLAQKLADGCIVVELWHQPPKRGSGSASSGSGAVTGRRLSPGIQDVLLGRAQVPLHRLLQRTTGVRGWYALESPLATSPSVKEEGRDPGCCMAGGVEISAAFTNEETRDLVVEDGLRRGWRAPDGMQPLVGGASLTEHAQKKTRHHIGGKRLKFEIVVSNVDLQLSSVAIPTASCPAHKYCFIRYRFFDKKSVVTSPKPVTYSREGIATYQLNHKAHVCLKNSAQLQWYLSEEVLEVQVWSTLTKSGAQRPLAEDTLLGSAHILLSDVISGDSINGSYPLFKAGVDRLGGQTVHVEVHKTVLHRGRDATPTHEPFDDTGSCIEVLDSSSEEEEINLAPQVSEPDKGNGDNEEKKEDKTTTAALGEEEDVKDAFSARVLIHEALHLPTRRGELRSSEVNEAYPSPYVTVHPHPNVDKITTLAVASSIAPVWEYQCTTRIPNHYLQPQSQGLEFQVWSKNESDEQQDSYIGSAQVDLCPLTCGLSNICGWYNIADFGGQIRGQLKISVAPTQRISYPSPLMAYSTFTTAASSFHSRDLPPPLTSSVKVGCGQSELSTERLLTTAEGTSADTLNQLSSQTRSMLFRQLREDIQQLDSIQRCLLTKLNQRDIPNRSSHMTSSQTRDAATIRDSGPTEAPPTAPPTLLHDRSSVGRASSPDGTYPVRYLSTLLDHDHQRTVEPFDGKPPSLLVTSGLTQDEVASVEMRERSSPPPDKEPFVRGSMEDGGVRSSREGSHTPLSISSRSASSLTDVSMCSKDSSSLAVERRDVESQSSPSRELTRTDSPCRSPVKVVDDQQQQCSDSDSTSTVGSKGSMTQTPEEEEKIHVREDGKDPLSSDQSSFPTSSTPPSHRNTTTAVSDTEPVVTATTTTTTASAHPLPLFSHDSPNSQSPPTSSKPSLTLHPPTIPSTARVHPPSIKLPNFFMSPQQLEESMRLLRAGALSRAPPKTRCDLPSSTVPAHARCQQSKSAANHLKTLQEVRAYLESRRTAGPEGGRQEMSAAETKRLARIFSS